MYKRQILPGVTLAFGLLIPWLYKVTLSGSGRVGERERSLLLSSIAVLILTGIVIVVRAFMASREKTRRLENPLHSNDGETAIIHPQRRAQFGLKRIFALTTFVAGFAALGARLFPHFSSVTTVIIATAVATTWAITEFRYTPLQRSQFRTLLAVMFLPFVWVIRFNKPFGHVSGMLDSMPIGPGLFPSFFIGRMLGASRDGFDVISAVVVIIELLVGLLLIRIGGRLSKAFLYAMFALTTFTSMFLHLMYRA